MITRELRIIFRDKAVIIEKTIDKQKRYKHFEIGNSRPTTILNLIGKEFIRNWSTSEKQQQPK